MSTSIATGHKSNRLAPLASRGSFDTRDLSVTIPAVVRASTCIVRVSATKQVAFWSCRNSSSEDYRGYAIMRSIITNGVWGPPRFCYVFPDYAPGATIYRWINAGLYGPQGTGRKHIIFRVAEDTNGSTGGIGVPTARSKIMHTYSDDPELLDWSTPTDITNAVLLETDNWATNTGNIIQLQAGPHAGMLVGAYYARESQGGGGDPYGQLLKCTNDADWVLGPRVNRAVSGNVGSSEACIEEIRNPDGSYTGKVYYNARIVASSPNDNGHKHCVVTDLNAEFMPDLAWMTDGVDKIDCLATQGSCCTDDDGALLVCMPRSNALRRQLLTIWKSTNAHSQSDPTFTKLRAIQDGWAGYSGIARTTTGNFVAYFEGVRNQQPESEVPSETLEFRRFSRAWLETSLADDPDIMDFHFNEGAGTGDALQAYGQQVRDHGRFGNHIQGYGCTGWTWEVDAGPGGGGLGLHLASNGSGNGLILQSLSYAAGEKYGGPWDWRNDSISLGRQIVLPSGKADGDHVLQDCRDDGTGQGYTIKLVVSGSSYSIVVGWNDGTTGNQTHTLADPPKDVPFTLWLIRDRAAGTVRLRADNNDNGDFAGAAATTDNNGNVIGSLMHRLCSQAGGNEKLASSVSRLRFVRGVAYSDEQLVSLSTLPKEPLSALIKAPALPTLPASWADCVAAIGCTFDGGAGVGTDFYGGHSIGAMPPIDGQGVGSLRCLKTGRLYRQQSLGRNATWVQTPAGLMIRQEASAASPHMSCSSADGSKVAATELDYIHNTGNFGICGVFRFNTGTTSPSYILSNRLNGGSAPCVELTYSATNQQLAITLRDNTGAISASAPNSGASSFLLDRYYFWAVSSSTTNWADGDANRIQFYVAEIVDGVVGTVTKISSATALSFGTDGFAGVMHIGSRNAATPTISADWLMKNLLFFHRPLVTAEYQEWANLATFDGYVDDDAAGDESALDAGHGIVALRWGGLVSF